MDRPIETRTWTGKRIAVLLLILATAAGTAAAIRHLSTPRLRVEREKLTVDTVRRGPFQETVLAAAEVLAGGAGLRARAMVDPFDARRLSVGQRGEAELGGTMRALEVEEIGPADGRQVAVTLRLAEAPPAGVEPGQSFHARFDLGQPTEALLLKRGPFFQQTGGLWVFVVDEASGTAARRTVRLGRQNPEDYEVLSGLSPGDRVITSTYGHLDDVEELILED